MQALKNAVKAAIRATGLELRRIPKPLGPPVEFSPVEREVFRYVRDHDLSMVSDERLYATILACRHVIDQQIPGDFVECGVFKGGNALIAAWLFKARGERRKVWLYDTFRGMTKPTEHDRETTRDGLPAMIEYSQKDRGDHNEWVFCPIEQVQAHFRDAGLLDDQVVFVQGDVLQTLRDTRVPAHVSVLRLDTDWYESTKVELEVLYPRLAVGGVLLIDDYGHFTGAQQATDEYFSGQKRKPLLNYVDYTGRVGVKALG